VLLAALAVKVAIIAAAHPVRVTRDPEFGGSVVGQYPALEWFTGRL
jgi:hypothetical protein